MNDARLIRDRVRGCLIGLTIGDALGAAFEMLTPEEIACGVNDPDGVTGFIKDERGCSDEIKRRLQQRPVGMTTDDTQLTDAAAQSLIRQGCFDLDDQAEALVTAYRVNFNNAYGWGGTTIRAAKELIKCFTSGGTRGRSPSTPAPMPSEPNKGCGNGVAMRVAPLALYHALIYPDETQTFFENVRAFGQLTHGDPRAWIAAMDVALVIMTALLEQLGSTSLNTNEGLASCDSCDDMQYVGLPRLMQCLLCNTSFQEETYGDPQQDAEQTLHWRLSKALQNPGNVDIRRELTGTSSFALESVPFSIATFFQHPTDFRSAVLEAVNAGGDTDTNAAMVGAMVGANVGESGIPRAWINAVSSSIRMRQLADDLVHNFS
jgi:ADP-ribosylglycohydrolase